VIIDEFDAKIELAKTFLRAGNDNRAEEICIALVLN
jgi:lipopolysaccharide biosynthesis regulator YciM